MSDQDDDKKILNEDSTDSKSDDQPSVVENNQPESVDSSNDELSDSQNVNEEQNDDKKEVLEASNEKNNEDQSLTTQNNENNKEENAEQQGLDIPDEKKDDDIGSGHQVIHKKDGRLHIYVRQDKYKGELKSKNWVGRLYIDGKQKISSSGTTNLDEAIPILEKWYDDIIAESERLKKQSVQTENNENQTNISEQSTPNPSS